MTCNCPKCRAEIELDLQNVTEKGCPGACPQCQARLFMHRESFAVRAYRKTGEITCASCGQILGPHLHCQSCGIPCPEYLVVNHGNKRSEVVMQKYRPSLSAGGGPSRRGGAAASVSTQAPVKGAGGKPWQQKNLLAGLGLLLLIAVLAAGYMFYRNGQKEKMYADRFVKLTYCIHSAETRSFNACTKIAADWRARSAEGQGVPPKLSIDEEKEFSILKSEIEKLQREIKDPPKKYQQCNELITALNDSAQKVQLLALNPSPALPVLVENTAKLQADYQQAARRFRSAVPADLMQELHDSSRRYKALKTLIDS